MTKKYKLNAKTRDKQEKTPSKGIVFGVVYGPKQANISLALKSADLEKIYEEAGYSSLIDLEIDGGGPVKVIIKDMQTSPVQNRIRHVDFLAVDMKKEIEVEVPLEFVGESKAARQENGTIYYEREALPVACTPDKFVDYIEVDLSKLETFDDVISAGDVKLPAGMELAIDPTAMIANVVKPKSAAEFEAEEQAAMAETGSGETKEEAVEETKEGEDAAGQEGDDAKTKE